MFAHPPRPRSHRRRLVGAFLAIAALLGLGLIAGVGSAETQPETQIHSGPTGPTNDASPSFAFSSSEPGSSFECRLDSNQETDFQPCDSPQSYANLADGDHTFEVRATDQAQNTDPTPASRDFTVDTDAPETQIHSGPTGPTNDASPSFAFSSSEPGSSFECRLDSNQETDFQPCDSPQSYANLADGDHTFEVRATDQAQNTDPTPASRDFTVDTDAPETQIHSGPTGPTNDASPSFAFSSSEPGSSFECRLDSNQETDFQPCDSPQSYANLADGDHTFEVRATDQAQNTDPTPASRDFTVDTDAPETTITGGPNGLTNTAMPSFSFSSSESGSDFDCRVDSGSYASCVSPRTTSALSDGPHTFYVRATDLASNADPSPASRSITVDTSPPETTITGGPNGLTNSAMPSFSFSSPESGSSFQCKVDSGTYGACGSPKTTSTLTNGLHTFYARAIDLASNADPSPASRSFTVDTTPPETTLSAGPTNPTNNPTPVLSFSSSEPGSSFQCKVDSDNYGACSSPKTTSTLANGPHNFYVRATDPAGNTDGSPASRAFTVKSAPNVLVIESDDQTVESMKVMQNVNSLIGARGATFKNSFVNFSLCCPSRSTFLTGQYAHNHGVWSNKPPDGGFDTFETLHGSNNLAVWLRNAGYYTAMIGKYLNGYNNTPEMPPGWAEWHAVAPNWTNAYNYTINDDGTLTNYGSRPADYEQDVLTSKAVDFVGRRAPKAQPFFLWLTYQAPHIAGPNPNPNPPTDCADTAKPAPRHASSFNSEPLPKPPDFNEADVSDKPAAIRGLPLLTPSQVADIQRKYRCQLESLLSIDEGVKKVIDALSAKGELSNTLIIYTSDNGYFNGEHRIAANKMHLYEESIRVPLEMRGPGIPAGVAVNDLAINADLAPTITQVATAATPGLTMDGRSLIPVAQKPGLEKGRVLLIEEPTFKAIRSERYIYAEYNSGEKELYDLQRDPFELQSRHNDPTYALIAAQLANQLHQLETCAGSTCRVHPSAPPEP